MTAVRDRRWPPLLPGRAGRSAGARIVALVRMLLLFESAMWSAVTPVLPHYARALHAGKPAIGLLVATYPAGMVPGALVGAWMVTRVGVRRPTLLGLLVFAGAVGGFGFGRQIVTLDLLRLLQGTGCGLIWGGGLTWVISVAPRARRGAVLGRVFAAATFGTLLGPILGTLAVTVGTRPVFAAVGAVALVLAVSTARQPAPGPAEASAGTPWAALRSSRVVLGFWLILLAAATIGALGTLLPLRLSRFGASGVEIGAVYLVSSFASMLLNAPVGRLVDRHGPGRPLVAGLTLTAALLTVLTVPRSAAVLGVIGALTLGGPLSAYILPAMAVITQAVEQAGVPLAMATLALNLAWAGGEMTGAPAAAALSQATSDAVPLLALAVLMAITLMAVMRTRLAWGPVAPAVEAAGS